MTFPTPISSSQANKETPIGEMFETLAYSAVYGQRHEAHSGLTWGYHGGRWGGFSVADGTLTLSASTTNYLVVAVATGVISTSTATTNWNDATNYVRVYRITTDASGPTNNNGSDFDYRAGPRGVHGAVSSAAAYFAVAASDEATALTTGAAKVSFHWPVTGTILDVWAGLTVAQTSGTVVTVDVNDAGATMLSTKITIDNTEDTSLTAATPRVLSDTAVTKGAKATIDIDALGDGTAKGLKLYFTIAPA